MRFSSDEWQINVATQIWIIKVINTQKMFFLFVSEFLHIFYAKKRTELLQN